MLSVDFISSEYSFAERFSLYLKHSTILLVLEQLVQRALGNAEIRCYVIHLDISYAVSREVFYCVRQYSVLLLSLAVIVAAVRHLMCDLRFVK